MGPALEPDHAGIGRLGTGDDLDDRALAAAVLAQQVIDAPAPDREVDTAQRMDAAEALVHALDGEEHVVAIVDRARVHWRPVLHSAGAHHGALDCRRFLAFRQKS